MSLTTDFLTTQNIGLLWDILSDGDIIKNGSKQYVENVFNVFIGSSSNLMLKSGTGGTGIVIAVVNSV